MTQTAYARAVEMFEALVTAPDRGPHTTPAGLIQAAGLSASSGYRHVAALEAEGLLRRDAGGSYLPGLSMIRIGLQAHGLGHLAPLAQPLLVQLRQATQHTAFIAVARDLDVHIGPHSVGRETRATHLMPTYQFESIPELDDTDPAEIGLRSFQDGIARRVSALTLPIDSTAQDIVLLGLILKSSRPATEAMRSALQRASGQIRETA